MANKGNWRRILTAGFAAGLIAAALSGTNVLADDIPTIRFAHQVTASSDGMQVIIDTLNAYIESVSDKYIVEQEVVAGDDLKTKIATDMSSNNLPDIMWYWGAASDAGNMIDADLLIAVDEFFEASEKLSRESFKESLWDQTTVNGQNYCLPVDNLESNWVVNKTILNELGIEMPTTYNELIAAAPQIKEAGYIPLAMGCKGGNPAHWWVDQIYAQYEGSRDELLDIAQSWNMDTENFRKALQVVKDLIDAGCLPEDTIANGDWGPYWALFTEGKALFSWSWAGGIAGIGDAFEWELCDMLKVDETDADTSTMSEPYCGAGLLINKESFNDEAKRAAIVDFVEYYCGPEFQACTYINDGVVPTLVECDYDASLVDPIVDEVVSRNSTRNGIITHMACIPNASVWADYQNGMDELIAGTMTIDEYIEYIQDSLASNKE